jgi:hypothetical protein
MTFDNVTPSLCGPGEEIGRKDCTSLLNSSQDIRNGRVFQNASIWGTVS